MTDPADPDLDDLLRRHLDVAIPDDGFSARVIAVLPPRPRQRPRALPLAAAVGTVFTWASIAPAPLWPMAAEVWAAGHAGTPVLVVCGLLGLCAMVACGWALSDSE